MRRGIVDHSLEDILTWLVEIAKSTLEFTSISCSRTIDHKNYYLYSSDKQRPVYITNTASMLLCEYTSKFLRRSWLNGVTKIYDKSHISIKHGKHYLVLVLVVMSIILVLDLYNKSSVPSVSIHTDQ